MGLDMYLSRRTYVKNYDFMSEDEKHEITIKKGGENVSNIDTNNISHVIEGIAYWRKANQIHNWFVENVQGGNDDCKSYYVTKEELDTLVKLCEHILEHKADASKLLPTASGFFFGGTEYNEYYYDDLKETVEMLKDLPEGDYYYESSW
jgi:hypothetical protein